MVALVATLCACASWQTTGGKLLTSTALTVDAGMKGWASWCESHAPTQAQYDEVGHAYVQYQAAFGAAKDAYAAAVTTGDQSVWVQASSALSASQANVLNLIKTFSSKTNL